MRNKFHVGAVGQRVEINNLPRDPELTPDEAIELAAWLVVTASPLLVADGAAVLGKLLTHIADIADSNPGLQAAARAELEG